MSTVINTPNPSGNGDSGSGIVIGVILAILVIVLFIIYGVPAIRNQEPRQPDTNIIVTPPAQNPSAN